MKFVLDALVITLSLMILNKWLVILSRTGRNVCFSNLASYPQILRDGWRIAIKNIRLFWVFLGFCIISQLQQSLLKYFNLKLTQPIPYIPHLYGAIYIHLPVLSANNLFFLILALFLIKPIKSLLSSQTVSAQPSIDFFRKNLVPFIAIIIILISADFYMYFLNASYGKHKILYLFVYGIPFLYYRVVVSSFSAGFVLYCFTRDEAKKNGMLTMFSGSLKYFKPLFMYSLIRYILIFLFSNVPTYISVAAAKTNYGSFWIHLFDRYFFISGLSVVFLVAFLFFGPFYIVLKNHDWKEAFKQNFHLWKTHCPEILILIISYVMAIWIFVQFPNRILYAITISDPRFWFVPGIFRESLTLAISFWFTCVIYKYIDKVP